MPPSLLNDLNSNFCATCLAYHNTPVKCKVFWEIIDISAQPSTPKHRRLKVQKLLIAACLAFACFGCGDDSPVAPIQTPEPPSVGAVSGIISDASTGNPIPEAAVTLLNQTVKSGVNGKYIFAQIPHSENLSLTVEAVDYATQQPAFALNTTHLVFNISMVPATNPEMEIRQFLDTLAKLIGSMNGNNLESIQAHFSQSYLAGADPVTRFFGLPTSVIPANYQQVIPWITNLFDTYNTISFNFYGLDMEIVHTQKASAQLNFDVVTEKGVRSEKRMVISECKIFFRKESSHWKIIFWQFSKFDIHL